jgi:acylphosphatase
MDAIPPQPPSIVRRHVYVSGRVQGVFFRDTCSRLAVDQMVDWCRQGPRGAIVTGIQVDDEPPEGLPYFRVR